MAAMDEFQFALKMRDIVKELVNDELQKQRPRYRYAIVDSVNTTTKTAQIIFNGDTTPVTVALGHFLFAKAGDVVRVDGIGSDKFIADIIGWDSTWAAAEVGVSAPTPNKTMRRNSSGQAQVENPTATKDIVNLQTLDNRVKIDNTRLESDLVDVYTVGITITDIGTTGSTNWFTTLGTVTTYKYNNTRAHQILVTKANPSVMYYRAANDSGVAWYGWSVIATKAQLDAVDALKVGRVRQVIFTTTGAGTWTKPAGLIAATVECVGGGGGSGYQAATGSGQVSAGNGGGGGGYTRKTYLASDLAATESYNVGVGGTGGASSGTAGTAGGDTTFKGLTANGGAGTTGRGPATGNFGPNSGGAGGSASGGDFQHSGLDGGGCWYSTGGAGIGGKGGDSFMGRAGEPYGGHTGTTWDSAAQSRGYGSGGSGGFSGASQSAHSGSSGRPGIIIITEYLSA